MEPVTPTKPPRGIKHSKDASGLLMSVIRALSASETVEQREREKSKLEKEYKKNNKRLEELVSIHDQELTEVIQLFGKLSARITSSREKISQVKKNLESCKSLLRCRRDELKKLWLEGVEHRHVIQLLEEIDKLREVPSQLGLFLFKKHYLHATRLLVSALSLGDGNLSKVEALREVRSELKVKRQILHTKLMEELRQHLYILPTTDALAFRRAGSGRDNSFGMSPFQRGLPGDTRGSNRTSKTRRKLLDVTTRIGQAELDQDLVNIQEDTNDLDPEERSEHFMAIIVECLAMLNRLQDSIEILKEQIHGQLVGIVTRTSRTILDTPQLTEVGEGQQQQQQTLVLLLESLFEQFRGVTSAHAIVLRTVTKVSEKHGVVVRLYEMSDVWSKIQTVLQQVVSDYLDVHNLTSGINHSSSSSSSALHEHGADLSSYFTRRKQNTKKRLHLFKFDSPASSALGINMYLSDSSAPTNWSAGESDKMEKRLVCQPDPLNVTFIFIPLTQFISEIENVLQTTSTLNTFLTDYVRVVFLGRHQVSVANVIDSATKSKTAWESTTSPELTKKMGLSRPLLQSTVTVEKCLQDLRKLMRALPTFAEHFLNIICVLLNNYRETCQAAYRGIAQPNSEDKRICSAAWLKDEDINRFIKSLPNWAELQTHKPTHRRGRTIRREETTEEESPEDIRQRNVKEAEILSSNMGESGISAHEILSGVDQLKSLASLHESMEWFASRVLAVTTDLPTAANNSGGASSALRSANALDTQALYQLVHEFTDLADTCLLLLHLEVRVQCFHYLLPKPNSIANKFAGREYLSAEPDLEVLELSKTLINIDEAMSASLQPRKVKYIFEGLGHLIAKILINCSQYMNKIDENGVQKMCRNIFTLQQTLTNVTVTREVALDHAKIYYELFYQTPDQILSTIMEKGAQFTDMEYMNAFQLLHRSHDEKFGDVKIYLQRLSNILGEIGVTV